MIGQRDALERRVLFVAPTKKDGEVTQTILEDGGILCLSCRDLDDLCRELEAGAGAVLLPEEAAVPAEHGCLADWLGRQPTWSDLPVLVLSRPGADSAAVASAMQLLGNVTVLERPIRIAALVSAIRSALRARQRQYQIRDHLAERETAAQALREADRRKDEFLAVLAHELRNPLAPLRTSLELLELLPPDDPATRRIEATMRRQVDHMVRLVDDLLEVSRITRGKIELRRQLVDVRTVLENAVETSRPLVEAGGHELDVALPEHPIAVHGDPVRLTQVVANLLNNSAKYTEPGGRIWLEARAEGDEATISVRDTGIGIPAHMIPHVFELFTQVERPKRGQDGLGIGLTLVKSLVEMHGGNVSVRSEGSGRGAEFEVRLPLAARASVAVAPPAPARSLPVDAVTSRRVLVVDDNVDAADMLAMLLENLGADVRVAYGGEEALQAFAEFEPTIALLDIGMPDLDGYEVARRIRSNPRHRDVTLVAVTGWGQIEDRARSHESGFDHHVVKPVDVSALEHLFGSLDGSPAAAAPAPPLPRAPSS